MGASFGEEISWGPELMVGWRQVASETLGDTRAQLISGGDAFRLSAEELDGQGLAARVSFKSEGSSGGFVVETGAEMRDDVAVYDLRLSAHFRF